jgi:hypothetical protein
MDVWGPELTQFEIFNRGGTDIHWTAEPSHPDISLSETSGVLKHDGNDRSQFVTVNWVMGGLPEYFGQKEIIHVRSTARDYEQVHLTIARRQLPSDFCGFVEGDGYISMHACSFTKLHPSTFNVQDYYIYHPYLGRTEGGGTELVSRPRTKTEAISEQNPPALQYDLFTFSATESIIVHLYFAKVLDTDQSHPLTYSLSFDDVVVESIRLLEPPKISGELPKGWEDVAMDCVWVRKHEFASSELVSTC